MLEFEKFKLGCLDFWCLDSAIWLTWYPSCLLVTAWFDRSIAFLSVFRNSQFESHLVENLESVNARKRMIEFGKLGLLLRQRGRLSAPREEAFVFFPLRYFARETTMSTPGHITITNERKTGKMRSFLDSAQSVSLHSVRELLR